MTGIGVASIVIPAHNEASVIDRTLTGLCSGAAGWQVIVVCNGCTDDTALRARAYAVEVIEISEASKVAALNAGDSLACGWPRLYMDADVEVSASSIAALVGAVRGRHVLAARPRVQYVTDGCSSVVRRYFRARQKFINSIDVLWGAGLYALSEQGRGRFTDFPNVIADDLWVDDLFGDNEKIIEPAALSQVRCPRTTSALLLVLSRVRRGSSASGKGAASAGATLLRMASSIRSVGGALDVSIYATISVASRIRVAVSGRSPGWERDESSRGG